MFTRLVGGFANLTGAPPPRHITAPRLAMIDYFSHADGLATFRPVGEYTLVSIVEAVNRAIAQCREQRIGRLLVVTHKVTGVSPPTLVDRFLAVEDWAHVAKGRVVVGLAISAANIHPQKFGVKVAASFGLTLDAFATEAEALEWLSRYDDKGAAKKIVARLNRPGATPAR